MNETEAGIYIKMDVSEFLFLKLFIGYVLLNRVCYSI